jgi:hypothetical protein
MKKITIIFVTFLIVIISTTCVAPVAYASMHTFCPTSAAIHGWWGYIYPTSRLCSTDYYTWNTNNGLSGEESWFISDAHYLACNYSSLRDPGNVASKVNIPSQDLQQTNNHAHYYKWFNGSNYLMIGQVPQYSVFGYYNLATVDWSQFDQLKLSDWTHDTTKYSKHVDLDAIAFDCYFN